MSTALPTTVSNAFFETAARYHSKDFIHIPAKATAGYAAGAVNWLYGDAARAVEHLTTLYRASGLRAGHRVALLLDNRAEFFLHWLALNSAGVSVVPLNPESSTADLQHVLHDSQAVMAVTLAERKPLIDAAAPQLPVHIVGMSVPACTPVQPHASVDECALIYTSGSTGKPKGCMLSNHYFLTVGRWYTSIGDLCLVRPGEERLITPLPLTHMNALAVSATAMILTAGCIVQLDRFHPRSWWQVVAESRATIVHYLGVMPAMLLQISAGEHELAHCLRFGFGAGVHPSHHAAFEQRFGFPLIESWSMTEVGGAAAVVASMEPRHVGSRCFGKPQSFMKWRLVDSGGRDVVPGEVGELLVRSAGPDPREGFFSGYANQPAMTEEAWAGGWFHTGDMVHQSEDGSLHFVDRSKSIVRRSGENIASLEVESVLNQIDGVRAVGVGPVDDEIRGEEVMACIVLAEGESATANTAQHIFDAANSRLTYYKVPGYIAFVTALPLTTSQKLQRGELKALSRHLVQEGQVFDLRHLKKRTATVH